MKPYSKSLYLNFVFCLFLIACTNEDAKHDKAMKMLDEARSLEQAEQYCAAIEKIDSAIAIAPIDTAVLRQATATKRHVYLKEANTALLSLGKKIDTVDIAIPKLTKQFSKIENKYYATELNYEHPYMKLRDDAKKPYLRLRVDSLGRLSIASVYIGRKAIKHTAIKLSQEGEANYHSQQIIYDKALNYRYRVEGRNWEVVSYGEHDSKAMAEYLRKAIAKNGKTIQLQFISKEQAVYKFPLSKGHCKAISKSLELYDLLHKRDSLRKQQTKYLRRFARLNQ